MPSYLRQYMKIFLNIIQTLEEFKEKAQRFNLLFQKIINEHTKKNILEQVLIDPERLFVGFYFIFIYKDFTIRELCL